MAKKSKPETKKGKKPSPKKSKSKTENGPKAAENKKRGATGTKWGLNVGQTWLKMLEDNFKKKLTDSAMAEFLRGEFPSNKKYSVADIKLHRNLFNRGTIRDQDYIPEHPLPEYIVDDDTGKKKAIPWKTRVKKSGGKKKKAKTEDEADDLDLDDDEEEEEDDDTEVDEDEEDEVDDDEEEEEEEEVDEPAPKPKKRPKRRKAS